MNDFHETENAMAKSGKTTNAETLISRSPDRLTNLQTGWIVMKTQAFGSSVPEGGAGRPGINEPFSM
jgi:hypothetical protein